MACSDKSISQPAKPTPTESIIAARSWAYSLMASPLGHGYLLDNGAFTQIDFPGALETQAQKINNRGQIVGIFLDTELGFIGISWIMVCSSRLYSREKLRGPFQKAAFPLGINDRGQIVGEFKDAAGAFHGFLLADGAFAQIDFPGAVDSDLIAGFSQRDQ